MKKLIIITLVAGLLVAQTPAVKAAGFNANRAAKVFGAKNQAQPTSLFKKIVITGGVTAAAAIAYYAYCAYTADLTPVVTTFTDALGNTLYNINGVVHTLVDGSLCAVDSVVEGVCTETSVYNIVSGANGEPVIENLITGAVSSIIPTVTSTATSTAVPSVSEIISETISNSTTVSPSVSASVTPSISASVTETVIPTVTASATETASNSTSATQSVLETISKMASNSTSVSPSVSVSANETITETVSNSTTTGSLIGSLWSWLGDVGQILLTATPPQQ